MDLAFGKMPSLRSVTNTVSNSRPFAACTVINCTHSLTSPLSRSVYKAIFCRYSSRLKSGLSFVKFCKSSCKAFKFKSLSSLFSSSASHIALTPLSSKIFSRSSSSGIFPSRSIAFHPSIIETNSSIVFFAFPEKI